MKYGFFKATYNNVNISLFTESLIKRLGERCLINFKISG